MNKKNSIIVLFSFFWLLKFIIINTVIILIFSILFDSFLGHPRFELKKYEFNSGELKFKKGYKFLKEAYSFKYDKAILDFKEVPADEVSKNDIVNIFSTNEPYSYVRMSLVFYKDNKEYTANLLNSFSPPYRIHNRHRYEYYTIDIEINNMIFEKALIISCASHFRVRVSLG